jgi:N utilization substance protein B
MTPPPGSGTHQRHTRARRTALQALYQWDLGRQDLSDIEVQFFKAQDMRRIDTAYFQELLHNIPAQLSRLDEHIIPCLDRPLAQVDPVERAILRIGAYELDCHPEIPWRVVINEAIELAKMFGGEQGHRYVNSVLDRLARQLRAVEIASLPPGGHPRTA